MINNNNMEKKDKRTEALTAKEIEVLKELSTKEKSFSAFALKVGLERMVVMNAMRIGTASPETVKKIRKFLQKQLQTA